MISKILLIAPFFLCAFSIAEGNEGAAHVIAKTLYLEARGEGEQGLRAVAAIIWNRAHERKMSLAQVCLQRKQFSCWDGRRPSSVVIDIVHDDTWRICLKIEAEMMSNTFIPAGPWNLYHNPDKCKPSWTGKGTTHVTYIGHHKFEREERG